MALGWGALSWLYWATNGAGSQEAESYGHRSLENVRRIGHRLQIAHRLAQLAQYANDSGDYAAAARFSDEGAVTAAAIHNPLFLSQNLAYRAEAAYQVSEITTARTCLAKACAVAQRAQFDSRLLLVTYHATETLLREAEQSVISDAVRQSPLESATRMFRLAHSHSATWHLQRTRIGVRLTQLRAEATSRTTTSLPPSPSPQITISRAKPSSYTILSWSL